MEYTLNSAHENLGSREGVDQVCANVEQYLRESVRSPRPEPLSHVRGLGWSRVRTVVTTRRNSPTLMATLPGGGAVTYNHPVRATKPVDGRSAMWLPAH